VVKQRLFKDLATRTRTRTWNRSLTSRTRTI